MIPIYRPYLPPKSLEYAHEALDSGWISSQGKYIEMVRERLQDLLGVKYVLSVNNGTTACHLMAKALKRKHNLDKIIVPNHVYVAAINAFLFDKDWKLFSVDCDIETWNYDLNALDTAIKDHPNAAVLLVHNMGGILNKPALQRQYPNTIFVEDACEALMGTYEGQYAGTASCISAFSTFANKTICSGEGGFVVFLDEEDYAFAKCIQGQGQSNKRFIHDELGFNGRITNIQSAILLGQLDILPEILERKNEVFERYRMAFRDREDVLMQKTAPDTKSSDWLFGVRVPGQQSYDAAEAFFKSRGVEIRPLFYPLNRHKHLVNNPNIVLDGCEGAEKLNRECVILPSFPGLTKDEQAVILSTVDEYVKGL
jgi:perosamine synthetase